MFNYLPSFFSSNGMNINSAIHKATGQAFSRLVGMTSETIPSCSSHSWLMGVSGIVPGKIMEWLETVALR